MVMVVRGVGGGLHDKETGGFFFRCHHLSPLLSRIGEPTSSSWRLHSAPVAQPGSEVKRPHPGSATNSPLFAQGVVRSMLPR